jgi:hypothetical protein
VNLVIGEGGGVDVGGGDSHHGGGGVGVDVWKIGGGGGVNGCVGVLMYENGCAYVRCCLE